MNGPAKEEKGRWIIRRYTADMISLIISIFVLVTFFYALVPILNSMDKWAAFEAIFGVVFRILGIFFYLYLLCSATYTVLGVFFKK